MQNLFLSFILSFLLNFQLIKSQACKFAAKKVNLIFYQYTESSPNRLIQMSTSPVIYAKYQTGNIYVLNGNRSVNSNILRIFNIRCLNTNDDHNECSRYFQTSFISLQHIMDNNCVMRLDERDAQLKNLIRILSLNQRSAPINLTCVLGRIYDEYRGYDRNPLADTNLFSIIFICSCIGLTCLFCFGWIIVVYYRRCTRYRLKKREQKELERCVQKVLEKSPVIIFNSQDKTYDYIDDESICSICLESFHDNEKLRKLICSHYFHLTCIEPWLLAHQNCPLCNRNILNDSIPSVSAQVASTNNQQSELTNVPPVVHHNPAFDPQD